MGRPTWKICVCNWIFLISLQPISLSDSAVPLDIVTEKVTKFVTDYPEIHLEMMPAKNPLMKRRYFNYNRPWRWYTTRRTTTKRYALFLKYYDSHYEEYHDFPHITAKPRYSAPGLEFGVQVAKAQLPPLLFKTVVGGGKREPRPHGKFVPPRVIHIPEEIENYTHVNFHFGNGRAHARPQG